MTTTELPEVPDEQHASSEPASMATALSKDDVFHLLQCGRRRAVLRILSANDDQSVFRMRDVAEAVAAWEHDTTVAKLHSDQRQRVYISLYQSHLPKLDEHGVIAYDQSRGIIQPRPLLAVLEPYLGDGSVASEQLTVATADADEATGTGLRGTVAGFFSR